MEGILASAPVVFIIIFLVTWSAVKLLSGLAFKGGKQAAGTSTPYACGEDTYSPMPHPDYSNFFQFAFFFTIAHVATLILTTVPVHSAGTIVTALIYVEGVIVGLGILLKK